MLLDDAVVSFDPFKSPLPESVVVVVVDGPALPADVGVLPSPGDAPPEDPAAALPDVVVAPGELAAGGFDPPHAKAKTIVDTNIGTRMVRIPVSYHDCLVTSRSS